MKHKSEIDGYSLEDLAVQVGDLRYDSLMEFLFLLSKKLSEDSLSDQELNRKNLASHLMKSSDAVWESAEHSGLLGNYPKII